MNTTEMATRRLIGAVFATDQYDLEARYEDEWEWVATVPDEDVAAELIQSEIVRLGATPPKYPFRLTPVDGGGSDEALYYFEGRWIDPTEAV